MNSDARQFLVDLLETPGVSGYEQPVQRVVQDYAGRFADESHTDLHGNLVISHRPNAETRVMLAGHCDQIGLLVSQIDDQGFLFSQTVGGWDPQQLVGQSMTVWTEKGPVKGVIARKPIHLLEESERKQAVKAKDLWIDIGCASKDEATEVVRIGDSVTFELGIHELKNGLLASPAIDDRVGVWVVVEALRRATEKSCQCGVFAVSTVQEEIGLRGAKTAAFSIDPHVGIAVDVTHATDCPGIDSRQLGDIKIGAGPVIVRGPNANPNVCRDLMQLANDQNVPYQVSALGRAASNDSNALQISRGGVATGVVAIPCRYMHSAVETIAWCDIDHAAELLSNFLSQISDHRAFIPV